MGLAKKAKTSALDSLSGDAIAAAFSVHLRVYLHSRFTQSPNCFEAIRRRSTVGSFNAFQSFYLPSTLLLLPLRNSTETKRKYLHPSEIRCSKIGSALIKYISVTAKNRFVQSECAWETSKRNHRLK